MIIGIIIIVAFFILGACLLSSNDESGVALGVILSCIAFVSCGWLSYNVGHSEGLKEGAYNLLNNKYHVQYVMSGDSIVSDTIIAEFVEK